MDKDGQLDIFDILNQVHDVDIKGICDDAYCPVCDTALNEYRYCDQDCPYCHARLDWSRWHRMNDDWWLNRNITKPEEVE